MKKLLTIICAIALVTSCKKSKTNTFTPTDLTGTTLVKGNISKNIITPNANGSWTSNTRIPAKDVLVQIKVDNSSLYPNSSAQGSRVYTGTTDADGNYEVSVLANATGVNAQVTINGFTGTLDTLVNGVTKKGFYSTYAGTNMAATLYKGQNMQLDYEFTASNVVTNPNNNLKIGTALVTGSVGLNMLKESTAGTLIVLSTTNVAVPGLKVYLNINNDPNTLSGKRYETTTDANGYYTFTVTTVEAGTPGFSQNATVWVNDYMTTRDTVKANNVVKTGRMGVFQKQTLSQNALYNFEIRNASNMLYTTFTPN